MTLFGKLTDEEGGRLAFPNHHLLVTGWQVLLWIRDGRGKETKLKKKKTIEFLASISQNDKPEAGQCVSFPSSQSYWWADSGFLPEAGHYVHQ